MGTVNPYSTLSFLLGRDKRCISDFSWRARGLSIHGGSLRRCWSWRKIRDTETRLRLSAHFGSATVESVVSPPGWWCTRGAAGRRKTRCRLARGAVQISSAGIQVRERRNAPKGIEASPRDSGVRVLVIDDTRTARFHMPNCWSCVVTKPWQRTTGPRLWMLQDRFGRRFCNERSPPALVPKTGGADSGRYRSAHIILTSCRQRKYGLAYRGDQVRPQQHHHCV